MSSRLHKIGKQASSTNLLTKLLTVNHTKKVPPDMATIKFYFSCINPHYSASWQPQSRLHIY